MNSNFSPLSKSFLLLTTCIFAQTALAAGVTLSVAYPPTPVRAYDKQLLVYELDIKNETSQPITPSNITIGSQKKTFVNYNGLELMQDLLLKRGETINPGETATLFVFLPFADAQPIPKQMKHAFSYHTVGTKTETVQQFMPVTQQIPIVLSRPLEGGPWLTQNGPSNFEPHRRTKEGPFIPTRFAIDWVKYQNHSAYRSAGRRNQDYYGFKAGVYAAVDGVVVAVRKDLPDNPHPPKAQDLKDLSTQLGNYVAIKTKDDQHYLLYAYLEKGSPTVKVGSEVSAGQLIGRVGASGDAAFPMLHFQVTDQYSTRHRDIAQGLPYVFDHFTLIDFQHSDPRLALNPYAPIVVNHEERFDELPLNAMFVEF